MSERQGEKKSVASIAYLSMQATYSLDYVRLGELCDSHEVAPLFRRHLSQLLQNYTLCLVLDDSC